MLAARAVLLPEALFRYIKARISAHQTSAFLLPSSYHRATPCDCVPYQEYTMLDVRSAIQAGGEPLPPHDHYLALRDKAKVRDNRSLLLLAMITLRVLQCQRFFREPNAE